MRRSVATAGGLLFALCCLSPARAIVIPRDAEVSPFHAGAWRFSIRREEVPLAVDGFWWERGEKRLAIAATAGGDRVHALERVSRQVQYLAAPPRRPIAAVNGDFYVMRGRGAGATIGLFVRRGELLSMGNQQPAFAVLADGSPTIRTFKTSIRLESGDRQLAVTRLNNERAPDALVLYTPAWGPGTGTNNSGVEVVLTWPETLRPNLTAEVTVAGEPVAGKGDVKIPANGLVLSGHGTQAAGLLGLKAGDKLTLKVATRPNLPVVDAVGGGPILLHQGKPVYKARATEPRHPRTAIGYDGEHIVALAIDGRRAGYSRGMTLPELSDLMQQLGCREALNLDGGGSTTCWVRGRVLNRPSDGRERSVANALVLLTTAPLGPPARIQFRPAAAVRLTTGASVPLTTTVTDALYNPLPDSPPVAFQIEGGIARIEDGQVVAGRTAGTGTLVARSGGVEARLEVTVIDQLAELRVTPSSVETVAGSTVAIKVRGLDTEGRPVGIDPSGLTWTIPEGWRRSADGTLVATAAGKVGTLAVSGYGARAEVPVASAVAVVVDDFEADGTVRFSGYPDTVTGKIERIAGGAASGESFLRLHYRLGEQPSTRAAYVRLDREIGAALALRARVRGEGGRVWLRAAVLDGNGIRTTHSLWDAELPQTWTAVEVRLPPGIKRPVTWQSVYYVAIRPEMPTNGWVDWDRLEVLRIDADAAR